MEQGKPNNQEDYGHVVGVETNLFDEREVHTNCTVEIWRNSVTGEMSIGWWENDNPPVGVNGIE